MFHRPLRTTRSGDDLRLLRAAMFAAVCVVLAAAGHTMASCATVPLWTLGAGFLGVLLVVAPLAGRERSLPGIAALLAVGQTLLHALFGLGQHGTTAVASTSKTVSDAALVEQAARLVCGSTAAAITPSQALRILVEARVRPAGGAGVGADSGGTVMSGGSGGMGMSSAHHTADALSTAGSTTSLLPSLPMMLAHLLAAVAAGWMLRRGDTALLRLTELSAQGVAEGALVRSLRGAFALARALYAGLGTAPQEGPRPPRPTASTLPKPPADALQHTVIRRGPPAAAALVVAA
ncbi:hypothetical protein ACIRG4_11405 [Streptomyces sp. NPDC102395]|uniref:hypothetical protein n=1 Tax=Streptomyces sp. NPDC102395 TaxID=3366168 RepID=UPI0037FE4985